MVLNVYFARIRAHVQQNQYEHFSVQLVALQCQSYLITQPKNGKSYRNLQHINPVTMQESVTKYFLFLSFRRVLNVICSFWGNSPASEF